MDLEGGGGLGDLSPLNFFELIFFKCKEKKVNVKLHLVGILGEDMFRIIYLQGDNVPHYIPEGG